jgi:hypothetical protein
MIHVALMKCLDTICHFSMFTIINTYWAFMKE